MPVDLETYLPVVLAAGKGNRMPTLTEHVWKPLLPVANLPLFWFPLNLLRRNGFKDCILVVPKSERANIERKLKTPQLGLEGLNIQVEAMDEEEAEDGDVEELGTADVVRMLLSKSKIKKPNVLFVSGDLVTDLCMDGMLKFHEEHNSMFTCLLSDFTLNGTVPGTKERQKKYRDLVIYSPESSQLLYMLDEEDYGQEESLPCALFRSAYHALATAAYKDVHLYIFKREALTILSTKKDFTSLKADLVPHLLNGQFSKSKRRNSSPNESYKCFAYLCTKQDCSMLAQCNHTGAYFEANKTVHRLLPKLHDNKPDIVPRVFTKESGVNCSDSWVSESAKVGTKCQIKRSIIGDNCELGQAAKVDNSVIMAVTQVQAGATIKNCIVFNDVNIGEKADLGMCIVAPGQRVQPKAKLSSVTVGEEREMDLGD